MRAEDAGYLAAFRPRRPVEVAAEGETGERLQDHPLDRVSVAFDLAENLGIQGRPRRQGPEAEGDEHLLSDDLGAIAPCLDGGGRLEVRALLVGALGLGRRGEDQGENCGENANEPQSHGGQKIGNLHAEILRVFRDTAPSSSPCRTPSSDGKTGGAETRARNCERTPDMAASSRSWATRLLATAIGSIAVAATAVWSAQNDERPGYRPAAYAIQGAKVVAGPGAEATIEAGTVVVRDGVIEAVGPADKVAVPFDAEVIDGKGLVVYAGFLDLYTTLGVPAGVVRSQTGPGRSAATGDYPLPRTPTDNRNGLTPEFLRRLRRSTCPRPRPRSGGRWGSPISWPPPAGRSPPGRVPWSASAGCPVASRSSSRRSHCTSPSSRQTAPRPSTTPRSPSPSPASVGVACPAAIRPR